MSARRFNTVGALEQAWTEYKQHCDNHVAVQTEFSQKLGVFVTAEVHHPITYTIDGFCVWAGIARKNFYASYVHNKKYSNIVTRMKEECGQDAREKFESGVIPTQLAGLWMSKHGYTTKAEENVTGSIPIVIAGGDALED